MPLSVVDPSQFGEAAARQLELALAGRPNAVVGLPTGNTPRPLYAELRRRGAAGWRPASMRVVMVDDYVDLGVAGVGSYPWLRGEVLDALQIGRERVLRIPVQREGITAACADFERALAAWQGCDLLYLGLGWNGHIGFNEPGAGRDARTRAVPLTPGTARRNALYWQNRVQPTEAVTMGIATMLEAKAICLLARGADKAPLLRRALHEPPTAAFPASWLQQAGNLSVLADTAAAPGG